MDYQKEQRIVMTLDAGGTNFVFSAIAGGKEIVEPLTLPAEPEHIDRCLNTLTEGFSQIKRLLAEEPVAISFAFPGPADYPAGIIGDLPNFPAFRGGVALGPYLEDKFHLPVFINNDGDLFAYGEALTGSLLEINDRLEQAGSIKRYKNLLGITLGTGFGAGVVLDGNLLIGDNAAGGDIWCFRNKKHPQYIAEESVSIRAVQYVYKELSGVTAALTPKDIFDIAEGVRPGDRDSARRAFAELGEMAGDVIAQAVTLVDGLVVIGGGLAGAAKYFMPALLKEMNDEIGMRDGSRFCRLQSKAFNLDDEADFSRFAKGEAVKISVPGSGRQVDYDPCKRIGVMISKQGASRSVSLGAYVYALNRL